MEIIVGLLAFVGMMAVFGIISLVFPYIVALLLLIFKHWIISIAILASISFTVYRLFSYNPVCCPGCADCDPQAFIGDDGEIHPGL